MNLQLRGILRVNERRLVRYLTRRCRKMRQMVTKSAKWKCSCRRIYPRNGIKYQESSSKRAKKKKKVPSNPERLQITGKNDACSVNNNNCSVNNNFDPQPIVEIVTCSGQQNSKQSSKIASKVSNKNILCNIKNNLDKTANCDAHAKFKDFSIDFILKSAN